MSDCERFWWVKLFVIGSEWEHYDIGEAEWEDDEAGIASIGEIAAVSYCNEYSGCIV